MRTPCVDAALAELQRAGIRDVEVARGTKHPQVRFRINGGPLHVFAVSGTPSDWRSAENTRRDLRRLLRELGVSAEPERPEPSPPRPEPKPDRISELERRVAARRFGRRRRSARVDRASGVIVVWFPPGEKNWNGATPNTATTHIAAQESLNGKNVDWMEKVSDAQYRR